MTLRDPAPFYAALARFEALQRGLRRVYRWSADGEVLHWTAQLPGSAAQAWQWRRGDAAPSAGVAADDTPPSAATSREFMRETYLVPEWPSAELRSPDGRWGARLHNGDVVLCSDAGEDRRATFDASADIGWDLEPVVADAMASVSPWSPDSRRLFALRFDHRGVWRGPRLRYAPDGQVRDVDHPRTQRAGTAIGLAAPFVLNTDGSAPVAIDLGNLQDRFVRLVGWRSGGRQLVLLSLARRLDEARLFVADAASGVARELFCETSPTFLRLNTVIWGGATGCHLLPDGRYLWQSERDDWNHLHLGHLDQPGAPAALTRGSFAVHDVLRCDHEFVWFRARAEGPRPYDLQLWRVRWSGGAAERMGEGDGEHEVSIAPDGAHWVERVSAPDAAPVTRLRRRDGTLLAEFDAIEPHAWLDDGWTAPEPLRLTAADGHTTLHGLLYRPPHFDPAQRYPLLHWVYGGPQLLVTPHGFAPRHDNDVLHHALADAGYLVLVLDARGTPGRSKAFQDAVWRDFVGHVIDDQVGALRQLIETHRFIDPARIGAFGRSWGALFALQFLAAAPQLYRAAACVVPGFDPTGGLIIEPYIGLPQEQPEAYRAAEPWGLPQRLDPRARVLLMAGTLDSQCHADMQRMSHLLMQADIAHQSISFAEQEHVFEGPARRFHMRALRDFFDEALA